MPANPKQPSLAKQREELDRIIASKLPEEPSAPVRRKQVAAPKRSQSSRP